MRLLRRNPAHLRLMLFYAVISNVMVLAPSFHMLQIYDRVLSSGSVPTLIYVTLIVIGAMGVYAFSEAVRLRVAQRFAAAYAVQIARKMFARFALLPDGSPGAGHYLREYGAAKTFLGSRIFVSLFDLPFLPLFLVLLFFVHPLICLITLVGMLGMIALAYLNHALGEESRAANRKADNDALGFAQSAFAHSEQVRALGLLPNFISVWGQKSAVALVRAEDAAQISSKYYALSKAFRQVLQVLIMAWGAWLVLNGNMSGGMIFMASMISGKALGPIEQAIGGWENISKSVAAFAAIEELTGEDKSIRPKPSLPEPRGVLTAQDIVFKPHPEAPAHLNGVSMQVVPGEIVALVGPLGSGKSLLARILAGALQPTAGVLLLDMAERSQWPVEQWGRSIGYMSEDVQLFPGDVAMNIARFSALPDLGPVYEAARRVGAHDAILKLPQGYQTNIGDGSTWLSVGQRQQIALARAFFGCPKVIILDQPTAHLDQAAEGALMNALADARKRGAAIVVISRRNNMLHLADRRLMVSDGKVELVAAEPRITMPLSPAGAALGQPTSRPLGMTELAV